MISMGIHNKIRSPEFAQFYQNCNCGYRWQFSRLIKIWKWIQQKTKSNEHLWNLVSVEFGERQRAITHQSTFQFLESHKYFFSFGFLFIMWKKHVILKKSKFHQCGQMDRCAEIDWNWIVRKIHVVLEWDSFIATFFMKRKSETIVHNNTSG